MKSRDSYVLQYISAVLTGGKSSRMVKRMVDDEKLALQVIAFNQAQEDYGKYLMLSLPVGETSLEKLTATMDEEIEKIKSELISEREYEKVKNQFEVQFIQSNTRIEGIANSLARAHMLYGDIDNINDQIDIYRSITREEIKEIANKYLNKSQRVEVDYLPKKK
jgi:predicted Zn-dependent peptidase